MKNTSKATKEELREQEEMMSRLDKGLDNTERRA